MKIYIRNLVKKLPLPISNDFIRKVVENTVSKNISGEIGIIFLDDKSITDLNKRYLNKNIPTDVLSFLYSKKKKFLKGEVIISLQQAYTQSKYYKNSIENELTRLIIHGVLHLIGWNDNTKTLRKKMWKRQEQILQSLIPRIGCHT